jgi:hypothetical protein
MTIKMTDGSTIKGTVNVGFEQRVSDLFGNPNKTFVPLYDTAGEDGSVVIVNKANVLTVEPRQESDEFVER